MWIAWSARSANFAPSTNNPIMKTPALSVVIPVYNEEDGLAALFARLYPALDALGISYEVVFVNDGSRDRSAAMLAEQFRARPDSTRVVTASSPSVWLGSGDRLRVPLRTTTRRSSYVVGAAATSASMNRATLSGMRVSLMLRRYPSARGPAQTAASRAPGRPRQCS